MIKPDAEGWKPLDEGIDRYFRIHLAPDQRSLRMFVFDQGRSFFFARELFRLCRRPPEEMNR